MAPRLLTQAAMLPLILGLAWGLLSCGQGKMSSSNRAASKSSDAGAKAEAPSPQKADWATFKANFLTLTENVAMDLGTRVKIEFEFSHTTGATWSLFASKRQKSLAEALVVAEGEDLGRRSVEWDTSSVAPGVYFLSLVIEINGQQRMFEAPGQLMLSSKESSDPPFVSLVYPNNLTRRENGQVLPIENNQNRLRYSLGQPLRLVYRILEGGGDKLMLTLKVSMDERTWQTVLDGVPVAEVSNSEQQDRQLEWVPPASLAPGVYTLRLELRGERGESYADQRFIGLGDLTWNGGVSQDFGRNCATSGCHDATTGAANRDFSRYEDANGRMGARQGSGNLGRVMFDNFYAPIGSNERNRVMPRGADKPLPPAVLGRFLNWEMRGTRWNPNTSAYDAVDPERKRLD
jgi:hypothetical protein